MIEQIGRVDKQDRPALGEIVIGDGRRQVGLAAAITAFQDEPAVRLPGVFTGPFERHLQVTLPGLGQAVAFRNEALKSAVLQCADLAQPQQAGLASLLHLGRPAGTDDRLAETGIIRINSRDGIPQPLAEGAIGLTQADSLARVSAG
jgi:hypothetical protein